MTRKLILGIFGVGIVLFLVVGVIVFKNYSTVERNRALLDKDGIETIAKVFRKEHVRKNNVSLVGKTSTARNRSSSNYLLHLRFDANSSKGTLSFNKALRKEEQDFDLTFKNRTLIIGVGESEYHHTELGDQKQIKYLPADPSVVEQLDDKGEYFSNNRLLYAIGLFLLAGLTVLLTRQYYKTGTTW